MVASVIDRTNVCEFAHMRVRVIDQTECLHNHSVWLTERLCDRSYECLLRRP